MICQDNFTLDNCTFELIIRRNSPVFKKYDVLAVCVQPVLENHEHQNCDAFTNLDTHSLFLSWHNGV